MFRVARLGRPHGLDGYLGLYVDPADLVHFEPGEVVHLADRDLTVRAVRPADRGHQVAFAEITHREAAEEVRGSEIYVDQRRELEEGEFWPGDLEGLEVRPGGGTVVRLVQGPAQDRLLIERDGVRFEVPFVEALVPVVDLEEGYVEVVDLEGLIPPSSE